ncbi:hypothetical protein RclHR1_15400001 [Rhizophagus clarus]|uniref:Transmembrane protein n=1 Tax=Rhizophagus clarus TaxID=94130 RepID=A0A2Z6R7T0_9GLOM|nr:hypothetical protein RclHR1_15400001 [Rhizophagus clarus]
MQMTHDKLKLTLNKQSKQVNQQFQFQINQLNQEKNNLQSQLIKAETNIQELQKSSLNTVNRYIILELFEHVNSYFLTKKNRFRTLMKFYLLYFILFYLSLYSINIFAYI